MGLGCAGGEKPAEVFSDLDGGIGVLGVGDGGRGFVAAAVDGGDGDDDVVTGMHSHAIDFFENGVGQGFVAAEDGRSRSSFFEQVANFCGDEFPIASQEAGSDSVGREPGVAGCFEDCVEVGGVAR